LARKTGSFLFNHLWTGWGYRKRRGRGWNWEKSVECTTVSFVDSKFHHFSHGA